MYTRTCPLLAPIPDDVTAYAFSFLFSCDELREIGRHFSTPHRLIPIVAGF